MAKKVTAKKRARSSRARKKPAPPRVTRRAPPGERRVPMLLAEHHVRVLEVLGRVYGCVSARGDVVVERVLGEILDRYGSVLLKVALPRRTVDEEE